MLVPGLPDTLRGSRSRLRLAAVTGEVVRIKPLEPGAEVFPVLHAGGFDAATDELTAAIVAGCSRFAEGAPLRDLPVAAFVLGVGFDPFENFAVALAFGDLGLECIGINTGEPQEALVNRAGVVVFAVLAGNFRAAFVQHPWKDHVAAKAGAATAGWMNGEVGGGEVDHSFVRAEEEIRTKSCKRCPELPGAV